MAGAAAAAADFIPAANKLMRTFPDGDPVFLMEIAVNCHNSGLDLQNKIAQMKEDRAYPKLNDRLEMTRRAERIKRFYTTRVFTPEEVLKWFNGDPNEYLFDTARAVSVEYKEHTITQINNDFPKLKDDAIDSALEENNYHYLPTYRALSELKDLRKYRKRKCRAATELPLQPDEEFYKELTFRKNQDRVEEYLANNIPEAKRWDTAKKAAAVKAVDNHVKNGMVVGIGSGTTSVFAIEHLAKRVKEEDLLVFCVPTSIKTQELILKNKLILSNLERHPKIDVAIDGADEVDQHLNLIKGGGGCHKQEKDVAKAAKEFIIIADESKNSEELGTKWKKGIPIEVLKDARGSVQCALEGLGGTAKLRMAVNKTGPFITDNGNLILDCKFHKVSNWSEVDEKIMNIKGVVETGLFLEMAKKVYFGQHNRSVTWRVPLRGPGTPLKEEKND